MIKFITDMVNRVINDPRLTELENKVLDKYEQLTNTPVKEEPKKEEKVIEV